MCGLSVKRHLGSSYRSASNAKPKLEKGHIPYNETVRHEILLVVCGTMKKKGNRGRSKKGESRGSSSRSGSSRWAAPAFS
jgi:hypothetical protein